MREGVKVARSSAPCRLYFLMARQAPTAVIFRRGPSKWVRLIRWNVADDTFEPGQWFKGRIYEKRSDLSPDGTRLVYFAQKINHRTLADRKIGPTWTAVSRPPYLTAVALWKKADCWNGGGLFESNETLLLNHPAQGTRRDREPKGLIVHRVGGQLGEDCTVLDDRLARDGWKRLQVWRGTCHESPGLTQFRELMARGLSRDEIVNELFRSKAFERDDNSGYVTDAPEVRERPSPDGLSFLRMEMSLQRYRTVYRFSLGARGREPLSIDAAEWADWDSRGRVAFARAGKMFAMNRDAAGKWVTAELADFNDQKPEALPTPAWASSF